METHPPLRIAVLSVHTCPLATLGGKKTGGMNVYVRELSKEMAKHGMEIDIFTRRQEACEGHLTDQQLPDGVRVVHIPAGSPEPLPPLQIVDHLDQFTQGIIEFAAHEAQPYDIIHSHYWLSGLVGQKLKAEWNIPLIAMFHTLGHMKNRIATGPGEIEPPLRIQAEEGTMREADCLIAATPAERIQLMWLYRADMHKITVIPPGVDVQTFHPIPFHEAREHIGVPNKNTLLLFVGRLEPLKGIDTLLRAIVILRNQIPALAENLCVSIIGGATDHPDERDAELDRLRSLREELGLGDLVAFLGGRSQETLPYYYAGSSVVVMPSHYESFGMVALEAMACGTPVVASEVGGLAYLVQDGTTGFHVPDRDPVELAGKIRLLLENEELRQDMSKAAAAYARKYKWSRIAEQIRAIYFAFAPDNNEAR